MRLLNFCVHHSHIWQFLCNYIKVSRVINLYSLRVSWEIRSESMSFCVTKTYVLRSVKNHLLVLDEVEGEVSFFNAKHWDRRNRADLIESVTPCHDARVVGPYRDSNPLHLTVLAAMFFYHIKY